MSKEKNNKKISSKTSDEHHEARVEIEILIFAIVLAMLILSSVMMIRILQQKPVLPSGESYYNLRIAQALKDKPFISKDPAEGTAYSPNPYHYLLALLLKVMPVEALSIFLPIILGLGSILLFFQLLLLLGVKHQQAAYSIILLSVTPAFLVLFTGLYLTGFVIFISLLIIFLVINNKKSKYLLVLTTLFFLILALASLTGFIIGTIALLLICVAMKRKPKAVYIPIILTLTVIVALSIFSSYSLRLLGFHSFDFKYFLSILGADLGFDIFLLVLFIAGFIILWSGTEEERLLHLAVLLFIIFSFFNTIGLAFSSFIITFYCVIAITYFYNRKWELNIIRTGTLLLVLCSLVFSATNQLNIIAKAQPDNHIVSSLNLLQSLEPGKVFTSEDNGFLVEYYTGKEVMLDPNSAMLKEYPEMKNDYNTLLMDARLKDAEPLLGKYELKYILITPEMKENLWENREQGLWFLVQNSESFIKKYESAGIELWEYKIKAPEPVEPVNTTAINGNAANANMTTANVNVTALNATA